MKVAGSNSASVKQLDEGIFLIPGRKSGGCNVFVLKGTQKVAMIDTGMPGDRDAIAAGLAEIGLGFDDVGRSATTKIWRCGCANNDPVLDGNVDPPNHFFMPAGTERRHPPDRLK